MKKVLTLILIFNCGVAAAQQYPELPLDKIITNAEQKAIGINKLSDIEKEKLRILIIEKYLVEHRNPGPLGQVRDNWLCHKIVII